MLFGSSLSSILEKEGLFFLLAACEDDYDSGSSPTVSIRLNLKSLNDDKLSVFELESHDCLGLTCRDRGILLIGIPRAMLRM